MCCNNFSVLFFHCVSLLSGYILSCYFFCSFHILIELLFGISSNTSCPACTLSLARAANSIHLVNDAMSCYTGNSETHFPIVYGYNLLMFFSPCCVCATANFELSME